MLGRVVQECNSQPGTWFGDGLPQTLRSAIELRGSVSAPEDAELAFVEVRTVSPQGWAITVTDPPALRCPVIGVSACTLDDLESLIGSPPEPGIQITRLICPVAVFDFSPVGIRVREVRHGLTAADLQERLSATLWSGPDLRELGTH